MNCNDEKPTTVNHEVNQSVNNISQSVNWMEKLKPWPNA